MQIHILKSKIHRATVTGASLNYEGSLTIDLDLMDKVGFVSYERVLCSNMANGHRFETYLIPGERGSGAIVSRACTSMGMRPWSGSRSSANHRISASSTVGVAGCVAAARPLSGSPGQTAFTIASFGGTGGSTLRAHPTT